MAGPYECHEIPINRIPHNKQLPKGANAASLCSVAFFLLIEGSIVLVGKWVFMALEETLAVCGTSGLRFDSALGR